MAGSNIPLCRLCRKHCGYCINIFDPDGNIGLPVWKIIEELLRFEVFQEDGMPQSICSDCFGKLSEFKNFKTMCIDSRLEFMKDLANAVNRNTYLASPSVTSVKCEEIPSEGCTRENVIEGSGPCYGPEDVKPNVMKIDAAIAQSEEDGRRYEDADSCKTNEHASSKSCMPFVFCEPSSSQPVGHSEEDESMSDEEKSSVEVYDEERESYNDNETGCYSQWGSRLRNNSIRVDLRESLGQQDLRADLKSPPGESLSTTTGKVRGEGLDSSTNQGCDVTSPSKGERPNGRSEGIHHSASSRSNDGPPYPCPDCWLVFSTQSYLKKHKRLVHRTPTLQTQSSESTKGIPQDSTDREERNHGYEEDTVTVNQDVVGCLEAGVVEPSEEGMPNDVIGVCGFVCDLCRVSFDDKAGLGRHVAVHVDGKIHHCPVCPKRFKWESDLRRHSMAHSNDRPYRCEECGRCFNLKSRLTKHSYTHTGHRPYKCEFCELRFTQKCFLKSHVLCHSGARPYQCAECHKTFNRKYNLVVHTRIHSDIKPFQCQVCFKKFNGSTALKRHLMTHTETKPFQCPMCNKSYNYKDTMRRHLLTHVGKQPVHECPVCNKKFTHTGNLNVHLRAHSGTKPHKCTECKESFARRDSLRKHLAVHSEAKP